MSYRSPHSAGDYFEAAALFALHSLQVSLNGLPQAAKSARVNKLREIDLCSRMAGFFSNCARLGAQGTNAPDITVDAPALTAEVKWFRKRLSSGLAVKDIQSLLGPAAQATFSRTAFVAFFNSTSVKTFRESVSITKQEHAANVTVLDCIPFWAVASGTLGRTGTVAWRPNIPVESYVKLHGGKVLRCARIGDRQWPVWAVVVSRVTTSELQSSHVIFEPGRLEDAITSII